MFTLSKVIGALLDPFIWAFGCLLLSFIWKKHSKRLVKYCLAILILFSNPFIANMCMRAIEYPRTELTELKTYQVGVVLTGMTNSQSNYPGANFESGSDRLIEAVALYHQGFIQKLLISGGSGQLIGEYSEAEVLEKVALDLGIAREDLIIEGASRNTYENAQYSSEMLRKLEYRKEVLLITSAFHMNRSLRTFEKAEIVCTPYPTDYRAIVKETFFENLIPSHDSLEQWSAMLHELFGLLYYRIAGYA